MRARRSQVLTHDGKKCCGGAVACGVVWCRRRDELVRKPMRCPSGMGFRHPQSYPVFQRRIRSSGVYSVSGLFRVAVVNRKLKMAAPAKKELS